LILKSRRSRGSIVSAELENEICDFLGKPPFNRTYRDLEVIFDSFLKGGIDLEILKREPDTIGISPIVYSPRRKRAYPELIAFMDRYRGEPITLDPRKPLTETREQMKRRLKGLAETPHYGELFDRWEKAIEHDEHEE
jgi:hypothetical protein